MSASASADADADAKKHRYRYYSDHQKIDINSDHQKIDIQYMYSYITKPNIKRKERREKLVNALAHINAWHTHYTI